MKPRLRNGVTFLPFKKEMKNYSSFFFRRDVFSAFSVALLALPQSIAYSLLAGLPPIAGFYSAIFGTIFTSLFGSSKHLVSGPTTGIAILIQTALSDFLQNYPGVSGLEKEQLVLSALMHIVLTIGALQLLGSFFNIGKFLQFVSRSVVYGYFAGVALAIVVNQIYYFFGIQQQGNKVLAYQLSDFFLNLASFQWQSIFLGTLSLALLFFLKKKYEKLPGALIGLIVMSLFSYLFNQVVSKDFIPMVEQIAPVGSPKILWNLPFLHFKIFNEILFSASAIAFVAVLEVFSVSRGLAAQSGQNIYSNQEVFGLGISNLVLSFFQFAIPASGSVSRSTFNFLTGAKTRFAALFSGVFLGLILLVLWPFVGFIPLPFLAALLILTAFKMIQIESIKICLKATRGDAVVFFLTMASCLVFSLDVAFFIGIVISIAFYLKRSAEPHQVEYAFNMAGRLTVVDPQKKVRRKVRIVGVSGELFFGTVDLFQNTMKTIAKGSSVMAIVLRLSGVYHVDASMCLAILHLHQYLKTTKRHLLISGISNEVWQIFQQTGIVESLGQDNLFLSDEAKPQLSTWRACLRAHDLINA